MAKVKCISNFKFGGRKYKKDEIIETENPNKLLHDGCGVFVLIENPVKENVSQKKEIEEISKEVDKEVANIEESKKEKRIKRRKAKSKFFN